MYFQYKRIQFSDISTRDEIVIPFVNLRKVCFEHTKIKLNNFLNKSRVQNVVQSHFYISFDKRKIKMYIKE